MQLNPTIISGASPTFAEDLLGRKTFADRLTKTLSLCTESAVVGLDGAWGEGKTTFAQMWRSELCAQGTQSLYLDAFAHDYVADPFLPIMSAIYEFAKTQDATADTGQEALRKGSDFLRSAIGVGWRVALKAATLGAVDNEDVRDMNEAGRNILKKDRDPVSCLYEEQIARFAEDHEALSSLRSLLESIATEAKKRSPLPLVFFVDELDRCRPDFAIQVIERIKHVFAVPNLCFVLIANRAQLERSIENVYGGHVGASRYLNKFVHLWCTLPPVPGLASGGRDGYRDLCDSLVAVHEFSLPSKEESLLRDGAAIVSRVFSLSPREVERLFSLLAILFVNAGKRNALLAIALPLAAMRLGNPELYSRVRAGQIDFSQLLREAPALSLDVGEYGSMEFSREIFEHALNQGEVRAKPVSAHVRKLLFDSGMQSGRAMIKYVCELFDMYRFE